MDAFVGLTAAATSARIKALEKDMQAVKNATIVDGEVEGGRLWLVTFGNKSVSCGTIAPAIDSIVDGYKSGTNFYLKRYDGQIINCGPI